MPFQICFTRIVTSCLPANPAFLRPFLKAVREELLTDATVESELRKPLDKDPAMLWLCCFGEEGVVYQIENDTQVKIFLSVKSQREGGFCEADLVEMIEIARNQNAIREQIEKCRNELVSMRIEEIEARWLPGGDKENRE